MVEAAGIESPAYVRVRSRDTAPVVLQITDRLSVGFHVFVLDLDVQWLPGSCRVIRSRRLDLRAVAALIPIGFQKALFSLGRTDEDNIRPGW